MILHAKQKRSEAIAEIDRISLLDYPFVVIEHKKRKRTNDQNSLHWKHMNFCVDKLRECGALDISDTKVNQANDLHDDLIKLFAPVENRINIVTGQNEMKSKRTKKMTTKEMADFINAYVPFFAMKYQITCPMPDDLYYDEFLKHYDQ